MATSSFEGRFLSFKNAKKLHENIDTTDMRRINAFSWVYPEQTGDKPYIVDTADLINLRANRKYVPAPTACDILKAIARNKLEFDLNEVDLQAENLADTLFEIYFELMVGEKRQKKSKVKQMRPERIAYPDSLSEAIESIPEDWDQIDLATPRRTGQESTPDISDTPTQPQLQIIPNLEPEDEPNPALRSWSDRIGLFEAPHSEEYLGEEDEYGDVITYDIFSKIFYLYDTDQTQIAPRIKQPITMQDAIEYLGGDEVRDSVVSHRFGTVKDYGPVHFRKLLYQIGFDENGINEIIRHPRYTAGSNLAVNHRGVTIRTNREAFIRILRAGVRSNANS